MISLFYPAHVTSHIFIYDTESLSNTRKNIIHSVDHILNHDLVKEDSRASEFVTVMETQIQNLKKGIHQNNFVNYWNNKW